MSDTQPKDFPRWMFHKDAGQRLFQTEQDLDQAGEGWEDSPEKLVAREGGKKPDQAHAEEQARSQANQQPEKGRGKHK